jgi:hypothetical protein
LFIASCRTSATINLPRMLKAVVILLLLSGPAMAEDAIKLPDGYTCADVRAKVKEYGWAVAYGWAKLHGYSSEQIAAARKCLHSYR